MIYKYPYFDAHCDTLLQACKNGDSINNSKYMVNINNLKNYNGAVQVFAIYNDGSLNTDDVLAAIDFLKDECRTYSEFISFGTDTKGIEGNLKCGKITALLSIESLGSQPDYCEDTIGLYHEKGIGIMGLCHNDDNPLCGGAEGCGTGLSVPGKSALRQMQSLGVILDVSHMSDQSFWDAASEYSLPFAATHSNSRAVCSHPRNLTDKQFVCLAKRGGVCGINFYPPFVKGEEADIDDVIEHIEHFMSLGGENSICLGSDFDGIASAVEGIENAGCVYRLFDKLLSLNYNETLINKIAFNNFHNFMQKFETLT